MPKYGLKFWYFYVVAAIQVSPGSHIGRKMWHTVLLPLVIQRGRKRMGLFYRNTAYLEDAAVQHHHHVHLNLR